MSALLAVHLAATWYMTGVAWLVQVVLYPMLGRTRDCFGDCHGLHMARMGGVVGPAMLLEAATAMALVWSDPDALLRVNLALLAVIWGSTFLVQVPVHRRLAAGWHEAAHRSLVRTNWVRTALWTARGVLLLITMVM